MPNYPIINFLVRHGHPFAIGVALLPALAGLWILLAGGPWLFGVGGLVAAPVLYVLMKSYVEMVAIIADMLLPK
jgi:predicted PurR-regulated permease PerM